MAVSQLDDFRVAVQQRQQQQGQGTSLNAARPSRDTSMRDVFLNEATAQQIGQVTSFIGRVFPVFVDAHRHVGGARHFEFSVDDVALFGIAAEVAVSLTNAQRDQVAARIKLAIEAAAAKTAALEKAARLPLNQIELERKRLLDNQKNVPWAAFLAPQNSDAFETEARHAKVLAEHRSSIVWLLQKRLVNASDAFRRMQEQWLEIQSRRDDSYLTLPKKKLATSNPSSTSKAPADPLGTGNLLSGLSATVNRAAKSIVDASGLTKNILQPNQQQPTKPSSSAKQQQSSDEGWDLDDEFDEFDAPVSTNEIKRPIVDPSDSTGLRHRHQTHQPYEEGEEDAEAQAFLAGLSSEKRMLLERENEELLEHFENGLDQIKTAVNAIQDISALQSQMAYHLQVQEKAIQELHEDAWQATEHVEAATVYLSNAKRLFAESRTWLLMDEPNPAKEYIPSTIQPILSSSSYRNSPPKSTATKSPMIHRNAQRFLCLLVFALICTHGIVSFTFSASSNTGACDTANPSSRPHPVFLFDPPISDKPLNPTAIITLFSVSSNTGSKEYNTHFADTLILAYSLLHHNETKVNINDTDNSVEVVVAYAGGNLTTVQRESFLSLGVRLLQVEELKGPNGTDFHKPCNACSSKIYLWALEAYFSQVLYLDAGVFVVKPITDMFSLPHIAEPLFAWFSGTPQQPRQQLKAVESFGFTENTFDTSVMLFKPSIGTFNQILLEFEDVAHFNPYYQDQAVLNSIFKHSNSHLSCRHLDWSPMPAIYNTQHPHLRDSHVLAKAAIVQHNFWNVQIGQGSPTRPLFDSWRGRVQGLMSFQIAKLNRSDVGIIPEKFKDLQTVVRSNMLSRTFVIHTLLTGRAKQNKTRTERVIGNRERYVSRHPGTFHYLQTEKTVERAVWQKAVDAKKLLGIYDWIWFLDAGDAFIMNGDIDLRVLIGGLVLEVPHMEVDILISVDMNNLNAGSFFMRDSEWTRRFVQDWLLFEKDPEHNEQSAIITLYRDNTAHTKQHLYEVPQRRQNLFNSYAHGPDPLFKPGDFVLHTPSRGFQTLLDEMRKRNVTEFRKRDIEEQDVIDFMHKNGLKEV
ncbi:hypothetical protein HDU79_002925 [Rhizoclosmatium sp. JEL0117]|nr:hypothetical protein HDU79_002925 [Rhizoclosmatium sp. JEL0117]